MGYSGGVPHSKEDRLTPSLEIAANVLMTASIILAGRNNIHSWWIGMVGLNSNTAINTRNGSRNQRHIKRVMRHHTSRQPKAAKA